MAKSSEVSLKRIVSLNAISALALPLAAVLTGPILARGLGPEGRGAMDAAMVPTLLAANLGGIGLPAAVLYFIGKGYHVTGLLRRILPVALISGLAGFSIIMLASPILLVNYPGQRLTYTIIAATLPVVLIVEILRNVAQAVGAYRLPLWERWLSVLVRTGVLLILFIPGYLTPTVAALVSWLPGIAAGLVYFFLIRWFARQQSSEQVLLPTVLRYSVRSWSGTVAGVLVLRLDQVLLLALTTPDQVAFYIVAVAIAEVPLMAVASVGDIVMTTAARRNDVDVTCRSTRMLVLLLVPTIVLMTFIMPVAVPLFFGEPFGAAAVLAQILLVASFFTCITVMAGGGLSALGRPGLFSMAQVSGVAVSVVLLLLLAPTLGGLGAALSSLGAYMFASFVAVAALLKTSGMRLRSFLVPGRAEVTLITEVLRRRLGAVARRS